MDKKEHPDEVEQLRKGIVEEEEKRTQQLAHMGGLFFLKVGEGNIRTLQMTPSSWRPYIIFVFRPMGAVEEE